MRLELRGGEGAGPLLSIWAQKLESLETGWYPLSARQDVREGARAGQGHIRRAWRRPQPRGGGFALCCRPAPQPLRSAPTRAGGQLGPRLADWLTAHKTAL